MTNVLMMLVTYYQMKRDDTLLRCRPSLSFYLSDQLTWAHNLCLH